MDKETKKEFQKLNNRIIGFEKRADNRFVDFEKAVDKKFDKMAMMVAKGFENVDKRFEENRKEHQEIIFRLDDIDTKVKEVAYRFEVV